MKKKNLSLFLSAASLTACILAGNSMNAQAAENVTINATNFPDENFRSFVRQYDQNENGILEASELAEVETIEADERGFEDLTGIKHFVNLQELNCFGNYLINLDVSGLNNLTYLNCAFNNLTRLDVSSLNNLTVLDCDYNDLTSLKLGAQLTELDCSSNNLSTLDISGSSNLTELNCYDNSLSTLDVSSLNNLTVLECSFNKLTSLKLGKNLIELDCSSNSLVTLDISNLNNLTKLNCGYNELTSLKLNSNLTGLFCYGNYLSSLDVRNLNNLTSLNCSANYLSSLDVSSLKNLTDLECDSNSLTSLNVSGLKNLSELNCSDNNLNSLNISGLDSLTTLLCSRNNMTSLNVSNLNDLTMLWCNGNSLTSLDVSSLKNLSELNCEYNNLANLNVSGLSNLTWLNCHSNSLTSLDVSSSKNLSTLNCAYNRLSTLDVSVLKNLSELYCYSNSLTSLNVSGLNDLTYLNCQDNHLTNLDASTLNGLAEFNCDNNVRTVSVSSKNQFDLSTLKGFDVTKCSNWRGGTVSGTILTFQSDTVTYSYDTKFIRKYSSSLVDFTLKKSSKLATPSAAKLSNTASGIKISWSAVSGAEKYRVYRKTSSTGWSKIADTTSTSYVDKTAKSGTSYTYTIRCINAAATAFTSDYNKTGSTLVRLAQPTVKAANASTGVKLSWSAVSGADSYILYYKTTDSWTRVVADPVKGTSYTWKGAKSGTSYKFTMKAVKGSTQSSYNTTGTALTYVAQPTVKAANASTGVKLSWSAISGADSYILYYKTTGGWTRVVADPVKGTSYTWKGAKSGTSYKFTMKAVKGSTQSSYNTTGTALVRLTQPTLGTLSRSGKNLTLTWSKVTGASAYRVYRKTGTGSWVRIATVTGTSYTDVYNDTSKLTKGTTYTYTVRAEKGSSLSSYNTTGKKITY